jgi:hypothetical protein
MKSPISKCATLAGLGLAAAALSTSEPRLQAQPGWPYAGPPPGMVSPTTPDAQRNAMNNVQSQVNWVINATRTASSFATGAVGTIYQQFQNLRGAYAGFTSTLTPQQTANGGNELAELSAGLDILQEAFTNYQDDLAAGRDPGAALRDMCQVLSQGAGVWLQEFKRDCSRLRVGW